MQARVKAVAEIVGELIGGVLRGEDVDLNQIKRAATLKYKVDRAPKLVEIIAAVPEEFRCATSHCFKTGLRQMIFPFGVESLCLSDTVAPVIVEFR